jgi:hypothetical protein
MLIGVGSAKGSPGATTLALALASVWPRPVLLVEADPDGGDLGARFAIPDRPGLLSLAAERRREGQGMSVAEHAQSAGPIQVVVAPADARQASAAVTQLGAALHDVSDVDLLVDVGRLRPGSPSSALVAVVDILLVVSGGDLASAAHTAAVTLQPGNDTTGVALVGESDFDTAPLREACGVPVLGYVPRDERGIATLYGGPSRHRNGRRSLLGAAATIADRLVRRFDTLHSEIQEQATGAERRPVTGERHDADRRAEPAHH